MDWTGLLNKAVTGLKNFHKYASSGKYDISKVIFTGSAIVMVTLAIASSLRKQPKKAPETNQEEQETSQITKTEDLTVEGKKKAAELSKKKKKKFKPQTKPFLTEDDIGNSEDSTTTGNGQKIPKKRKFVSDYEGDERYTNNLGSKKTESKITTDSDDLYFMMFNKLTS